MLMRLFDSWAEARQDKELRRFLGDLAALDDEQVGAMLAGATQMRHALESVGIEALTPERAFRADPGVIYRLSQLNVEYLRKGQDGVADWLMVWVHTFRAAARPALRPLGRALWRELGRGRPHVFDAATELRILSGVEMDLAGFDEIPEGMESARDRTGQSPM